MIDLILASRREKRSLTTRSRNPNGGRLLLRQQIWDLNDEKPAPRYETSFTFSRKATNWNLYNPYRESTFLLYPEKDTAARPSPVQKVMDSRYMRVGASFFMYQEGDWVQETDEGIVRTQKTPYWEQISFRHPYRLRSRTKDLEVKTRPKFTWYQQDSDTDDSTLDQSSNDESGSDTDDSTLQQFSDEESGSDSDEQQLSESLREDYSSPESLASNSEDTTSESESSGGSSDSDVISGHNDRSSSESASDNSPSPPTKSDGHGE